MLEQAYKPMTAYRIIYKTPRGRKWRACSLSMWDRKALEQEAVRLADEEGWKEYKILSQTSGRSAS